MITLGNRSFAGPFLLPLWSPPRTAGLFAVMVPGWRLLTFRALHFGALDSFSMEGIRTSARYAEWISVAGQDGWTLTDWFENVYLSQAGPEKYDALAAHEIKWTDPTVVDERRHVDALRRLHGFPPKPPRAGASR